MQMPFLSSQSKINKKISRQSPFTPLHPFHGRQKGCITANYWIIATHHITIHSIHWSPPTSSFPWHTRTHTHTHTHTAVLGWAHVTLYRVWIPRSSPSKSTRKQAAINRLHYWDRWRALSGKCFPWVCLCCKEEWSHQPLSIVLVIASDWLASDIYLFEPWKAKKLK